ncbi:MAG: (2Fe-2S)-binding protein [Robiginitomaculum sp.]|nr:MAG: (2Fe-2S)-binding protein [Robiginitomaculum sp.]
MIVCICRNINDKAVRDAVGSGARRAKDVQAFHGCSFNCGMCKPMINEIIAEETPVQHLGLAAE